MRLEPGVTAHMSYTAAGYYATGGSHFFHFPDGNASIARLLVRDLIPDAMPGHSAEDVVTARANYAHLDKPDSPVRIRLNSAAVRVRHLGDPATAKQVEISRCADLPGCRYQIFRIGRRRPHAETNGHFRRRAV